MVRYNTLKQIENFTRLIQLGIIPIVIMDWIVIYEYYKIERETLGKMQSYCNTADNYRMSEKHIMSIVKWMETN